jgi:hypothetical protein
MIVEYLKLIDLRLLALVLYMLVLGVIGGVTGCHLTHKQRGIEVDRLGWRGFVPMPPPPVIVPDTVPKDWVEEHEEAR